MTRASHSNPARIHGVLDNDPEKIPTLHSGDEVDVRQEDVFDYLLTHADNTTEGNTTGPIIQKLTGAENPNRKPKAVPACDPY